MSRKIISDVFLEIADAIESGNFGKKPRIGLTILGSEHGIENMLEGAKLAKSNKFDIVLIGPKNNSSFETVEVITEEQAHQEMEKLLDNGSIDACVTMHYNFPIGVSTVGRVVTPGKGKEMILATTTGTSATNRVEAMVKNAIAGIATAKAIGWESPTVGILNVDGARQTEKALKELSNAGYPVVFADSLRADKGVVMRGNDLLLAAPDVMVTDSLTGNLLMKMFSSYTTGGNYESHGYGYGPGVGENYSRKILILSRASGAPVVANAIKYACDVALGSVDQRANEEFALAKKAGLDAICTGLNAKKDVAASAEATAPPKEVVTESISGIEILDLDDAVAVLWKNNIYAESGMGCTGPIVLVSTANKDKSIELLIASGYVS